MKIYILGSGGIGGYFGSLFAKAGLDVTFIARGENYKAIKENGLIVKSVVGNFEIKPAKVIESISKITDPDLIIFSVKTYDTEIVAKELSSVVNENTIILTFQNGVDNDIRIRKIISNTQVYPGVAYVITAKIVTNNQINTELEEMAKTLYDYWFVQFDFPNKEGKPYKTNGGKMVWNEKLKREIPEGWSNGDFSNISNIVGGSTPSTKNKEYFNRNGTAWITPNDLSKNIGNKFITRGELDVSDRGLRAASLYVMPKGTILLSSRAPIGYLAISREPVTTNQGFKSLVPKPGYSTPFVYYSVKNLIPAIINNANGSTFKEISGSTLKTVSICIPKPSTIEQYSYKSDCIFEKQSLIELENQKLAELRDWLLPLLMNGQIEVNV